jgi:hypothetical protein
MRHGPHHHPCARCKAKVECCGDIEQNYDGFPEWTCREYHDIHTGQIAEVLCELCDAAAVAEALADEQENV